MALIDVTDLPEGLQTADSVVLMVAGANAIAARVAPCLTSNTEQPTADQTAEARLILLGMIRRWVEAGSGSWQQQTAGPFGVTVDTRQKSSGYRPYPSEVTDLQALCSTGKRKAYSIDTVPTEPSGYWSDPYNFQTDYTP